MLCYMMLVSLAIAASAQEPLNIDNFGAIEGNDTYEAAITNGLALLAAMNGANSGVYGSRTVLIPYGNYYMLPATTGNGFENMNDVTLVLDGTVWAWTEDFLKWPNDNGAVNLFQFTACSNLVITGNGIVEGQVGNRFSYPFDCCC